ncbi:unnamed protein product, partial [Pocillopora meandrina]
TNGCHSDEETLVGGLDTSPAKEPLSQKPLYTGQTHEELPREQLVADNGEDLGRHQAHGEGPADVEGARCCLICLLGVKDMSELSSLKGNLYRCSRGIRKAMI